MQPIATLREQCYKHPKYLWSSLESLLIKEGGFYIGNNWKGKKGTPKECFRNAFKLSSKDANYVYTEGLAFAPNLPLPLAHAWCTTLDGKVYDPTWPDGVAYLGIPVLREAVLDFIGKQGHYGILDYPNLPLQTPLEQWLDPRVERTTLQPLISA